MSLINQVLNDLEKRGAAVTAADPVRAVPVQPVRWRLLAAIGSIVVLVPAGVLWKEWRAASVPAKIMAPPQAALPRPLPSAANTQSAMQPAAGLQPHSAVAAASALHGSSGLASHMSLELAANLPEAAQHKDHLSKPEDSSPAQTRPAGSARKKTRVRPAPVAESTDQSDDAIKRVSPKQQAEDEYSQAMALISQGRKSEAQRDLENAIRLAPSHQQARQALVGLLLDEKHNGDAERVLRQGLRTDPKQVGLAMLLARLQVERGALTKALGTLQKTERYAGEQADFQAFLAAVLQRMGRHDEAVAHYQAALRQSPNSGVWLMGLGISLQALKRNMEARDAFRRAIDSHSLSAELQDFVGRRLKEL
jgi:MSHA biogenesis protein MshN